MTKTLALFLDALSHQYVNEADTPNIAGWANENGVAELEPLFGFQGVATSMFTGATPNETGIWTDLKIREAPVRSGADPLHLGLDRIPDSLPRKVLVTLYERYRYGAYVTPHRIPAHLRPHFESVLHESLTSPHVLRHYPTIFDTFRDAGKTVYTKGLSGGIQRLLIDNMPRISSRPEDLVMLKINLLDGVGHAAGPDSKEVKEALRWIDKRVGESVARNADKNILIFSDHGMTPTTAGLDLRGEILRRTPGLAEAIDYVPFYNSTCALFRWKTEDAHTAVHEAVADIDHVHFLSDEELGKYHIDGIVGRYCDDVAVSHRGHVISPDFYTTKVRTGMHGYATLEGEKAVMLSPNVKIRSRGAMWDVGPTILAMAGLERADTTGRALLI